MSYYLYSSYTLTFCRLFHFECGYAQWNNIKQFLLNGVFNLLHLIGKNVEFEIPSQHRDFCCENINTGVTCVQTHVIMSRIYNSIILNQGQHFIKLPHCQAKCQVIIPLLSTPDDVRLFMLTPKFQ